MLNLFAEKVSANQVEKGSRQPTARRYDMAALIPHAGFGSLDRLTREVDGLWDAFFGGGALARPEPGEPFVPAIDVKETGEGYEITAEAPGLSADDIKVGLEGDVLTISGEKKSARASEDAGYHLFERRFGSFRRGLRLPREVDREKLSASHKDGVLRIVLPFAAEAGHTEVKVAEG